MILFAFMESKNSLFEIGSLVNDWINEDLIPVGASFVIFTESAKTVVGNSSIGYVVIHKRNSEFIFSLVWSF